DQYETLLEQLLLLPFNPEATEPADPEWTGLVNGDGLLWQGLKAIRKNYVYCKRIAFAEVTVSTTGAGKSKVKLSTVTDWNQKYVARHNEMLHWLNGLQDYLEKTEGLELVVGFPCFGLENQYGL